MSDAAPRAVPRQEGRRHDGRERIAKLYPDPGAARRDPAASRRPSSRACDPKLTVSTITKIRQLRRAGTERRVFQDGLPGRRREERPRSSSSTSTRQIEPRPRAANPISSSTLDVRRILLDKADARDCPTPSSRRWLYTINEGKFAMEQIEKDFDSVPRHDERWNLIQKHFVSNELKLEVTPEEADPARPKRWPPSSSPITA